MNVNLEIGCGSYTGPADSLIHRKSKQQPRRAAYQPAHLWELPVGETGFVEKINATGSMRRRLQDIGLIEGTIVQCVLKSPFGDPVAYFIRGATIALRSEDSKLVDIRFS